MNSHEKPHLDKDDSHGSSPTFAGVMEKTLFFKVVEKAKKNGSIRYEELKYIADEMRLSLGDLRYLAHLYLEGTNQESTRYEVISLVDGPYARDAYLRGLLMYANSRSNIGVLLNF